MIKKLSLIVLFALANDLTTAMQTTQLSGFMMLAEQ